MRNEILLFSGFNSYKTLTILNVLLLDFLNQATIYQLFLKLSVIQIVHKDHSRHRYGYFICKYLFRLIATRGCYLKWFSMLIKIKHMNLSIYL